MPTNAYTTAIKAQSNLLAYWELAETAGTSGSNSVIDQTGNNDGTPTSVTFGATGTVYMNSVYASFNGSSSIIDCGAASNLNFAGTTAWTFEGWFNCNGSGSWGSNCALLTRYANDTSPGWEIRIQNDGAVTGYNFQLQFELSHSYSANQCIEVYANTVVTLNVWHHYVVTYSGSGTAAGVTFYLDGEPFANNVQTDGLAGLSTTNGSVDACIGARSGGSVLNFPGYLSNISVTSGVMTPATVAQHFVLGWNIYSISQTAVPVIFDGDGNTDVDDHNALACLHFMQNRGECTILGVMSNSGNSGSANAAGSPQVFNAINTYFARPFIPIGRYSGALDQGGNSFGSVDWNTDIPANYTNAGVPTPGITLYRTILAAQTANSVTIVITGIHTLLAGLLASPSDGIYAGNGVALVAAKVSKLVVMGGSYNPPNGGTEPGGAEYNFYTDPTDANYTFANWPSSVPIYLSGYEIGANITPGVMLGVATTNVSPVRKIMQDGGVLSTGHPCWDQTAALYAVRGGTWNGTSMWTLSSVGNNVVNSSTGVNTFTTGSGNMYYLINSSNAALLLPGLIDRMESETPNLLPVISPNYIYSTSQPVDVFVLSDDI